MVTKQKNADIIPPKHTEIKSKPIEKKTDKLVNQKSEKKKDSAHLTQKNVTQGTDMKS